jgi:hypothetical protein
MNSLNKEIVKTQIPALQKAIKEHLKVDAGKQAAYHIFAVSNFFRNDQQMKAELSKNSYSLSANFGTTDFPCIIKHELGLFSEDHQAIDEAELFLRSCQKTMNWELVKNDEDTGKFLSSFSRPEKGLNITIEINAEKYSDVEDLLGIAKEQIMDLHRGDDIGFGTDNNCEFHVSGEEYDVIADIDCLVGDNQYIIFDRNGIIDSDNSEDEIISLWENRDSEYDSWESYLIQAENVELSYALENDEQIYHAISRQSGSIYSGEIMDILDTLKHEKHEFSLFLEIDQVK